MSSWLISALLVPVTITASLPNITDDVINNADKEWRHNAIEKLWKERHHMGHTPLVRVEAKGIPKVELYLKNETAAPSGSLKHRFARALVLWAIIEGKVNSNTNIYDGTSGNSGASASYMCKLIGVNYTAVVENDIGEEKIHHIKQFGGSILKVSLPERHATAERMAKETGGLYLNQLANAEAAEDFHDSGDYNLESMNVFHEIVEGFKEMNETLPDYFVHAAGTGGTISSVGKYITRYNLPTKVILADSQFSLFYDYVLSNKYSTVTDKRPAWVSPGVEGIGFGYNPVPIIYKNSTSLLRSVIDEVTRMPDLATIAAMRCLRERGIDAGPSTALNFLVSLYKGTLLNPTLTNSIKIVFINGDPGSFYHSTYLNDTWIANNNNLVALGGMKTIKCWKIKINEAIEHGINFITSGRICEKAQF